MLKIIHMGKIRKKYQYEPHEHDYWEAVYYFWGKGFVKAGNDMYPFESGDVFIFPPNMEHTEWSEEGFQDIYIAFERCELSENSCFRFKDGGNLAVFHILDQMYDMYKQVTPNHIIRENIINQSFDLFFQYVHALSENVSRNRYVEMMKSVIISNLENPDFSVKDVVKELHLSQNYVRDLFVKYMDCTPNQYLMTKRLDNAKQLLAVRHLSNYSIRQVAEMCGFSDPCYFSRAFLKYTGVSPREWGK